MRGFMDGYQWQGDEDDYEVVHGGRETVRNNGQQDNSVDGGREDEESLGHDHDAGHNHHVEDAGHDDEEDQDKGHDHHEDEDAGEYDDGPSSQRQKVQEERILLPSRLLHSKSEGDPAVYQLPPRTKTSLRLRGEDQ